jgi:glycosyltransferase involved in cell wall biosynthesis
VKRVLMVAFQFPPFSGSSAIQRTLRFVQHLPRYGWEAVVLTADARAYEAVSQDLLGEIPAGTVVERAFALDTRRHLAIGNRYPAFLARPDRWFSWRFGAVSAGRRLIARYRPAALWSTFPIATAHVIGSRLQRSSGLPWIADFRDPMAQDGYPPDPATWASFKSIEKDAVYRARFSVFTTPGAARVYAERYPEIGRDRLRVVENGFDEESFVAVERSDRSVEPLAPGRVTLLHSGAVYPSERDPTQFFSALGQLKREGVISAERVQVRFRASGQDALLRRLASSQGVEDLLDLPGPVPYQQALDEMLRADALLILQAANCNEQIPAKLYEYLRARRPIVGLTDPSGDTAATMRAAGVETIARLDNAREIAGLLKRMVAALADGRASAPQAEVVARCSRQMRAAELAGLLEEATSRSGG